VIICCFQVKGVAHRRVATRLALRTTSKRLNMVSPMQGAKRRNMGFRIVGVSLQSGLEEGEPQIGCRKRFQTSAQPMFALFEAGIQVICTILAPRFGCASRGANHVAPLRGAGVPNSTYCPGIITLCSMIGAYLANRVAPNST